MKKSEKKCLALLLLALLAWTLLAAVREEGTLAVQADETRTVATVESETVVSGACQPGSTVSVTVINFRSPDYSVLLYADTFVVGASGLYQTTVPLPIVGEQTVAVYVAEPDSGEETKAQLTTYVRYDRDLGETLSGVCLNLYDFLCEEP